MRKSILAAVVCLTMCTSVSAFTLKNPQNDVSSAGDVYDVTSSKYTETGSFTDSDYVGYNRKKIRTASGADAIAEWTDAGSVGFKYDVYIWKTVLEDGDKNARAVVTTNTEGIEKRIDFSTGYSGWVRVGVVSFSDAFANIRLVSGDGNMPVSCFKYVESTDEDYYADRIFDQNSELMILKKDSAKVLHNHEYKTIEDTVPTIKNNTMLLPLRFISENMGYECVWNESDRSVTVTKDGSTVVFYISSLGFTVNGEARTLGQAPEIIGGRTMLPIRALSESFGNDVIWDDSGVVLIGKNVVVDENVSKTFYEAINKIL